MSPRRSAAAARQTRSAIVDRAVDVASVEGLQGITIGRLAGDLDMSKSGVVRHFPTKEALQLRALERAIEMFRDWVLQPTADRPPGLERLLAVCDAWIAHLEVGVFPGGCFMTSASCEFDGRPGPVRDAVVASVERWKGWLADEVRAAIAAGDLPAGADPELIAFQLNAIAMGANQAIQLGGDPAAGRIARRAMGAALGQRTVGPR